MLNSHHPFLSVLTGFVLSSAISALALKARALNYSGAMAACLVGGLIIGFGGWVWAAALLTFFATSTALGKAFGKRRQNPTLASVDVTEFVEPEKGGRRDALQVLANGGVAAACATLYGLTLWYTQRPDPAFFVGFLASLSTANGDTWATEIGSAFGRHPRMLTTGRRVPAGTSGAITLAGTAASILGAGLLGLFALRLGPKMAATIWACGLFGVVFDSFMGATLQAQWIDPVTGAYTEKLRPGVRPNRGLFWMRNDQVNFLSIICSALLAIFLYFKI